MLAVYIPYTDSSGEKYLTGAEIEQIIDQRLNSKRLPGNARKRVGDLGLTVSFSWCREIAVDVLARFTKVLPPGSLDIHGIRKHGECWSNQPTRVIGNVTRPNQMVDGLFTTFFQMMVEMLSYILDTDTSPLSPRRLRQWLSMWNYAAPSTPVGAPIQVTCTLNAGELDESSVDPGQRTVGMLGTITGIPIHWAKSSAVMSYLLLLPRLWSLFYGTPRILGRLTTLSRRRYTSPLLKLLDTTGNSQAVLLWSLVAKRLMLPFWLSTFGKGEFWHFTYLLMYDAMSRRGGGDGIPNFANHLYKERAIDGFVSWCSWFNRSVAQENLPWAPKLLKYLREDGVMSVVTLGSLCKYI